MRISKRVREEAIEACLCRAYLHLIGDVSPWSQWREDVGPVVAYVARRACIAQPATAHSGPGWLAFQWLEAAALLRGGWSPGDPVTLLKVTP
jgi:hypothetical protein